MSPPWLGPHFFSFSDKMPVVAVFFILTGFFFNFNFSIFQKTPKIKVAKLYNRGILFWYVQYTWKSQLLYDMLSIHIYFEKKNEKKWKKQLYSRNIQIINLFDFQFSGFFLVVKIWLRNIFSFVKVLLIIWWQIFEIHSRNCLNDYEFGDKYWWYKT